MNNALSFVELNDHLVSQGVENVVSHLIGAGNYSRNGKHLCMSAYDGGASGGSFVINLEAAHPPGHWYENNEAESDRSSGDLAEYWTMVRGLDKKEAYHEIKNWLGLGNQPSTLNRPEPKAKLHLVKNDADKKEDKKKRLVKHLSSTKDVSVQSLKKFKALLSKNQEAIDYLTNRGLSSETIDYFNLGLSQIYKDKKDVEHKDSLVFPLINQFGKLFKPYAYYNVPGVSLNPATDNGWCASSPRLSYNTQVTEKHQYMVVVEGFKDLWILHQHLQGTDLSEKVVITTSTHGSNVPVEVQSDPTIFNGIKSIFLAFDGDEAGNGICEVWKPFVGQRGYRVKPFEAKKKGDPKDWTDYFQAGKTVEDFVQLLKTAEHLQAVNLDVTPTNLSDYKPGQTYAYNPIDISGAYVNGHLYYTVIAHETGIDPETQIMAHARVIKVIRSDGEILDYRALPMLRRPGAMETPIYAMSDGTVISDIPKVAPKSSWHWDNIQTWLKGEATIRPLGDIVKNIILFLKGQIWLPNDDDYVILGLTVIVTYVQTVFQAVGYLLATGQAGTGKSQLGEVMVQLCANGTLVGDTSAATITRTLDQTRGFLVLDDIEKLTKTLKGGTSSVDDLLQILKVSYKKSTATRAVTDTKNMTVKMLDFYGVKFMTNTTGIEDILGTRTFILHTQKAKNGFKPLDYDLDETESIRHELHAWAMNNISLVEDAYRDYPTTNRSLEISAPLRAIADICEEPEYHLAIDRVLERREMDERCNDSPESLLKESVLRLASQGYTSLFIEHVIMEMSLLVPSNFGKEYTTDIPWWQKLDEVRQRLTSMGYIPRSTEVRKRPYGRIGLMREYPVTSIVFDDMDKRYPKAMDKMVTTYEGREFCRRHETCEHCPYATVYCEIRHKTGKARI
jgi:hypothetical protein